MEELFALDLGDLKAFKLFVLDIGLLSCMVKMNEGILLNGNEMFKELKGALMEQYALQQMKTLKNIETYYWSNDRASAEVDFIISDSMRIIPVNLPLWAMETIARQIGND